MHNAPVFTYFFNNIFGFANNIIEILNCQRTRNNEKQTKKAIACFNKF
jgi:hypothetical protein